MQNKLHTRLWQSHKSKLVLYEYIFEPLRTLNNTKTNRTQSSQREFISVLCILQAYGYRLNVLSALSGLKKYFDAIAIYTYLLLFLTTILLSCQENNFTPPKAGKYGNHVILAYNESTKEISGIYKNEINTNLPADSCYFYFVGKFSGQKTNIISWRIGHRAEEVFGVLEAKDANSFHFSLEKAHKNCREEQDFSNGVIWTISEPANWRYIRTVRAESASIHAMQGGETPLDTVLFKGAILKVLDKKIDWVKVETLGGWVREKDLVRFPG